MKFKNTIIALPFVGLLLTGCVGKKTYPASDYMLNLSWKTARDQTEDFRILQLNDIHLSQSDIHEEHFKVIDKTIEVSNPDLIVLCGDIFTYADKHVVKKVFNHFNDKGIPWTYVFGNHDDQGYYADNYIQRLLGTKKAYNHCYFVNLEDDDVSGRSNFVINILDEAKNPAYQVFLLDSHNYNFETNDYDHLKQDQIDWYERMVKYTQEKWGVVYSAMYMHIGFKEFTQCWEDLKGTEAVKLGNMEEWSGSPDKDLDFYSKIRELGVTRSISVAHDHANDSVVKYEDVYFSYGVHSTNRIYNDKNNEKFGGQIISIDKTTKKLSFTNYYIDYGTKDVRDIVDWKEE